MDGEIIFVFQTSLRTFCEQLLALSSHPKDLFSHSLLPTPKGYSSTTMASLIQIPTFIGRNPLANNIEKFPVTRANPGAQVQRMAMGQYRPISGGGSTDSAARFKERLWGKQRQMSAKEIVLDEIAGETEQGRVVELTYYRL